MAAGDPVYGSDFADLETRVGIRKVKNVSQQRVSTTTYADDAELKDIQLTPGNYHIRVKAAMYGGTGGIPLRTQWGFSGTWNNPLRLCTGPTPTNVTAGTGDVPTQRTAAGTNIDIIYGLGTSGTYLWMEEESMQVVVTATGLFAVRWSPTSLSATSGGFNQGSMVTIVPFD